MAVVAPAALFGSERQRQPQETPTELRAAQPFELGSA